MRLEPRALTGVVIAALLVACGQEAASRVGDTPAPQPATPAPGAIPSVASAFRHPFEYALPPRSELAVTTDSAVMYALTEGSDETYPGYGYETVRGAWGVSVTSGTGARTHTGWSRGMGALRPEAFLMDLRRNPSLTVGPITPTTLGGLPALQADVEQGSGPGYPDIHMGMDGEAIIALGFPSRLIVAEVGGEAVLVHIWAGTDEELAAWLPAAMQLMESINFVDPATPIGGSVGARSVAYSSHIGG